jgi:hypothetical protein
MADTGGSPNLDALIVELMAKTVTNAPQHEIHKLLAQFSASIVRHHVPISAGIIC